MPKAYSIYRKLFLLLLLLLFNNSIPLAAQDKNPFEIRSRALFDSTEYDSTATSSKKNPKTAHPPHEQISNSPLTKNTLHSDMDSLTGEASAAKDPQYYPRPDTRAESMDRTKESENVSGTKSVGNSNGFSSPPWWIYVYDLVLLLLLAGAFLYDKTIFPLIRKAFIHENFLRFLYRDTYLRKPGMFLYLNIIFVLATGFFLFRIGNYLGIPDTFLQYLIIQGVVWIVYLIKHLALYLLSRLVDNAFEVRFYQYWMILAAGYIGLSMVPMVLILSVLPSPYLNIALIISLLLWSVIIIYRLVKAMLHARIFLYKHFLQFILYFCAVEIIPIIVFTEILTRY